MSESENILIMFCINFHVHNVIARGECTILWNNTKTLEYFIRTI